MLNNKAINAIMVMAILAIIVSANILMAKAKPTSWSPWITIGVANIVAMWFMQIMIIGGFDAALGRPANLNQLKDGEELYVREVSHETSTILCVTRKGLRLFSYDFNARKGWKRIVKEKGQIILADANDNPLSNEKRLIRKKWKHLLPHMDQIL